MNKKTGNVIIGIIALALVAGLFGLIYSKSKPQTTSGAKEYTLEVVDNEGNSKVYTARTDAEYLRGAMDELAEAEDFSYSGEDSQYGIMIQTVNGVTADYNKDNAWWGIYVNGNLGEYGADSQPVNDGDSFVLLYEKQS